MGAREPRWADDAQLPVLVRTDGVAERSRGPNRRRGVLHLGLLLAVAALLLLAAAAPARAGWPSHDEQWTAHAPSWGAGTFAGWGKPNDFVTALVNGVDVVQYGDPYLFYRDPNSNNLVCQAFASGSGQFSSQVQVAAPGTMGGLDTILLGACATGNDVFVFYLDSDPKKPPALYWTQAAEDYNVQHSVPAPWVTSLSSVSDALIGSRGHTPNYVNIMAGDIAYLDGMFAFVSPQPASGLDVQPTYNVFLTDLTGTELPNAAQSFTPGADDGVATGQGGLRDLSALSFVYQGDTYLAVGSLYGQPAADAELPLGGFPTWSNVRATVYLSSVDENGFVKPQVDRQAFALSRNVSSYQPLTTWGGPCDITLLRGGVSDGPSGDRLTALIRECAVSSDSGSGQQDFEFELYGNFQLGVGGSGGVPDLSAPGTGDAAYLERLPEQDNNHHYFPLWDPQTTVSLAWTAPIEDGSGPSTSGAYPYTSWRNQIFVASSASVYLYEQGGSKSSYYGQIGSVLTLSSDKLQPVAQDTTDEDGDPLPTAMQYPYTLPNEDMAAPDADPSQAQLDGVAYGSPPLALNGWDYSDLTPGDQSKSYSWLSFGDSSDTTTTTATSNSGGISLGFSYKSPAEGPFRGNSTSGASAGWSIDKEVAHIKSSTRSETWDTFPASADAGYDQHGQIFYKQPVWEVQRFAREDWQGTVLPDEYLVAVNCVDNDRVEGTFGFDMTAPGSYDPLAPFNTHFAGMTGAPATSDYEGWHERVDPVAMAGSHGEVVELPDGKTKLEAVVSADTVSSTQQVVSFATSDATTDSTTNTVTTKTQLLFIKGDYTHTWESDKSVTTGQTFQFGWRLLPQAVTVPDVIGEPVQQAVNELAAAALRPVVQSAALGTPGTVSEQYQQGGAHVGVGSTVTVSVTSPYATPTIPASAVHPPDVASMTVEGVFMTAKDDQAYWIPSAYRDEVNGQKQKPWCVDWSVLSYTPGQTVAATSTAARSCGVKVRSRPVAGGSASILDAGSPGGYVATAGSDGVLIAARPATGYRFAGWHLDGAGVARVHGGGRKQARVVPRLAGGGVTLTARFARIRPERVSLRRIDWDSAHVRLVGAPLERAFTGPVGRFANAVAIRLGDDLYPVPARSWRVVDRGSGRYRAAFHPRAWDRRSDELTVLIDARANRFSVWARGADGVDDLHRAAASGRLDVALLCAGRPIGLDSYPVACAAKFAQERTLRTGLGRASSAGRVALDLGGATLRVRVDPRDYRRSSLVLDDVRVAAGVLDPRGFDLELNGLRAKMGAGKTSGSRRVSQGRTGDGIRVTCRWTAGGVATFSLSGGYLERGLTQLVGRNVTLGISGGATTAHGTLVTALRSLSPLAYAPRLADD